jgi:hypothetical protein
LNHSVSRYAPVGHRPHGPLSSYRAKCAIALKHCI